MLGEDGKVGKGELKRGRQGGRASGGSGRGDEPTCAMKRWCCGGAISLTSSLDNSRRWGGREDGQLAEEGRGYPVVELTKGARMMSEPLLLPAGLGQEDQISQLPDVAGRSKKQQGVIACEHESIIERRGRGTAKGGSSMLTSNSVKSARTHRRSPSSRPACLTGLLTFSQSWVHTMSVIISLFRSEQRENEETFWGLFQGRNEWQHIDLEKS